jgi:hypothetical protein
MWYLFYVFGGLTVFAWICASPNQDVSSKNRGEIFFFLMVVADFALFYFCCTWVGIASFVAGIVVTAILLGLYKLFSG